MSFQVWGCIITSLGNMHPSQQIWRKAFVSSPFSSLSQSPASTAMSSIPLGSVAWQWRPVLSCEPEPKTVASFWATSRIERKRYLSGLASWAGSFAMLSAVRGVGDRHPGQRAEFLPGGPPGCHSIQPGN